MQKVQRAGRHRDGRDRDLGQRLEQRLGRRRHLPQYPYQVRYYLNQLYDLPVPTTSATTLATPANHVAFPMATLKTVFTNTMQKMAYAPTATTYRLFTAAQAQAAFAAALTANGVAATATLDLATPPSARRSSRCSSRPSASSSRPRARTSTRRRCRS